MTSTFNGALEYAIILLIITSCIYTSLAMIVSAIEHIKEFLNKKKK